MSAAYASPEGLAPVLDAVRPVLDRAYLARFTFGNPALEREVLRLFADQAPRYIEDLAAAADAKAWREAAHTLKGSAAAVGAKDVAHLAALAERLLCDAAAALPACSDRDQAIGALRSAVAAACREIATI